MFGNIFGNLFGNLGSFASGASGAIGNFASNRFSNGLVNRGIGQNEGARDSTSAQQRRNNFETLNNTQDQMNQWTSQMRQSIDHIHHQAQMNTLKGFADLSSKELGNRMQSLLNNQK